MKKLIVLLVLILCSCSVPEKEGIEQLSYTEEKPYQEIKIAEASTKIIDNGENRVNNILLACRNISGTMLSPGEEFSFNKLTGRKTIANGYKSAPIIVDGEKSYGIGGGVCQVSTTIYMAALSGGFEVTEHHNHSEAVAYAPKGSDATVVYGAKDLCFKNNKNEAVYIYVWVENSEVIAKIISK